MLLGLEGALDCPGWDCVGRIRWARRWVDCALGRLPVDTGDWGDMSWCWWDSRDGWGGLGDLDGSGDLDGFGGLDGLNGWGGQGVHDSNDWGGWDCPGGPRIGWPGGERDLCPWSLGYVGYVDYAGYVGHW